DMKKMLAEAGSKSGRDMNKFEEFSIDIQTSKKVKSPAIAGCNLVFECKTVFKQTMDPDNLDLEIKNRFYSDEDYHVMYYGEILDCYLNE
ncbi:MAG TPA: flavin reductase family protein, partial [Syntrophomonadaceae bacterium]|nr:flavin reductase family protein [Syntrophomonadaceae bacterium]